MAMDSTVLPGTTTMTFCLGPRSSEELFTDADRSASNYTTVFGLV